MICPHFNPRDLLQTSRQPQVPQAEAGLAALRQERGSHPNNTGAKVGSLLPWEPITLIFRAYNPYIGGLKPSFFMVLGSKGIVIHGVINPNNG